MRRSTEKQEKAQRGVGGGGHLRSKKRLNGGGVL